MMRFLAISVLVALAAVAAGCGGDGSDGVEGPSASAGITLLDDDPSGEGPCGLLTSSELSEVTDQVIGEGALIEGGPVDACEWISTEASASPEINSPMKVTVTAGELTPAAADELDEIDSPGRGFRVDGLGDDAVMACGLSADIGDGCASYGPLIVVAGDRFVTVEISSFAWPEDLTQDQVRDGLQVLARSAIGRL